jgi:hypothetical protein
MCCRIGKLTVLAVLADYGPQFSLFLAQRYQPRRNRSYLWVHHLLLNLLETAVKLSQLGQKEVFFSRHNHTR